MHRRRVHVFRTLHSCEPWQLYPCLTRHMTSTYAGTVDDGLPQEAVYSDNNKQV